jgi:hypothetical protein
MYSLPAQPADWLGNACIDRGRDFGGPSSAGTNEEVGGDHLDNKCGTWMLCLLVRLRVDRRLAEYDMAEQVDCVERRDELA